jgi:hypothetical protein
MSRGVVAVALIVGVTLSQGVCLAEGRWEVTKASEEASRLGLRWLARNQGEAGNWESKDLGLVSVGALAFMSAGHTCETGLYSENVRKAVDYVLAHAKPSGLLNIAGSRRDMYNHGLATFVLTQAYGMTSDRRVGRALQKAIKVIADTQCHDGGWDYIAKRQERGHDLSLAVMQAKALRGSMDIGIHIPRATIGLAIKSVQGYYRSQGGRPDGKSTQYGPHPLAKFPGRFTYNGGSGTTAMAAAGAVCLQEYGQYDDFRIYRSMDGVCDDILRRMQVQKGHVPFDAYTMYYVAQALYQVGGTRWREYYPKLRDAIVNSQTVEAVAARAAARGTERHGSWAGRRVGGKAGQLFGTAVCVFALNIPNRYLPILQKGEMDKHKGGVGFGEKKKKSAQAGRRVRDIASAGRPSRRHVEHGKALAEE